MRQLLTGPNLPALEREAMTRAAAACDGGINDVLLLTRDAARIPSIENRWQEHGSPLSLQVSPIDAFVHECHEAAFHTTDHTHMRSPTRDRLMEVSVERLTGPDNPLAVDGLPSRGLCDRADEMLTLMEFADLQSAESIEDRLRTEGLDRQAAIISELESAFTAVREEHVAARTGPQLSIRSERYSRVVNEIDRLSDVIEGPEVVLLSGFTLFSPLERRFIAKAVEAWPTIAILPTMVDGAPETGIDAAIARVYDAYVRMGLVPEHHVPSASDATARWELAARLFRHRATDTSERVVDGLDRYDAPTRPMELRYVARSLLDDIDDGYAPSDIGVVLSSAEAYGTLVDSVFRQYDVPYTGSIDRGVLETAVGGAVADSLNLIEDAPRTAPLISLLANPLVEPWEGRDAATVVGPLRDIDQRLDSGAFSRVRPELPSDVRTDVDALLERIDAFDATDTGAIEAATRNLLENLGIDSEIEEISPGSRQERLERGAVRQLLQAASEVSATGPLLDDTGTDGPERLERALQAMVVESSAARDTDRVVVTNLTEVGIDSFERVYLVGQSAGDFPSNPDRLAFTRPINEAHDDFAPADTQLRARYHATVLLAAAESVTVTRARRDLDGKPLVESDLLAELRRISELGPRNVDLPPGAQEDVQRAIAMAGRPTDDKHTSIDAAHEAGTFTAATTDRAHAGTELAAARRSPEPTPYDGRLSAEVTRTLHDTVSYAPTKLETYAACGFKYLMKEVIDISEPDELRAESTALERGSFIHDVLERFYLNEIQTELGEPVTTIIDDTPAWQERLLEVALDALDTALIDDPTAFQAGWLEDVFAGLGSPEANPFYGAQLSEVEERGVLRRFLEEEAEMNRLSVNPTWFEARFGPERDFDRTVLRDTPVPIETPDGPVSVTGTVDRIDTVETTLATELVVRDYKTGFTPSEAKTLDGLRMQLPIYALMAERVLDERLDGTVETVGGSYYQVRPPGWTSHNQGQIGSRAKAAHARSGSGEPLIAWRYPRFDTHESFRAFIETTVPKRLGQIATGIEEGVFGPTILDPDDAGCRYCAYSHVCDVRSHRRHETMDELERRDEPAYIPPIARNRTHAPDGGDV